MKDKKHSLSGDKWIFEEKVIRGIMCSEYGQRYDASLFIRIINGQLHVDSLISKVKLSKSDYAEIERQIKSRGFTVYYIERLVK
jgi:hypothetical protein